MKDIRIAVAGSVNMDLVFRCPRLPLPGETLSSRSFAQAAGGKGANQAVAAARQGAKVSMIGQVGDDAFGASLMEGLRAEGIGVGHLGTLAGVPTGLACILVGDDGANSIVVEGGANMRVGCAEIDAAGAAIDGAGALICQLEIPLDAVRHALARARAAKVPVILNPAPAQPIGDDFLALADYLVVNESEAESLSGMAVIDAGSAERAALALRARGAATVLLTLGAQGVVMAGPHGTGFAPAVPVTAVDTTAAGDTFIGAFAVALLEGGSLSAAVARAQHAAALAVTRPGAQASVPHRAEVDDFMAAHGAA